MQNPLSLYQPTSPLLQGSVLEINNQPLVIICPARREASLMFQPSVSVYLSFCLSIFLFFYFFLSVSSSFFSAQCLCCSNFLSVFSVCVNSVMVCFVFQFPYFFLSVYMSIFFSFPLYVFYSIFPSLFVGLS